MERGGDNKSGIRMQENAVKIKNSSNAERSFEMSQLMVIVNEYGKVVEAKALDSEGKIVNIEYGDEEKRANKSIIGARLYTPNGCCWRKVGGVWICSPDYCG